MSLQRLILDVLESEAIGENKVLSVEDIAKRMYGAGFTRSTAWTLTRTIKTNMYWVQTLAASQGRLVIPVRDKPQKEGAQFKMIVGWKIADFADERYILKELMLKREAGESRIRAFNRTAISANQNGLLSDESLQRLTHPEVAMIEQ